MIFWSFYNSHTLFSQICSESVRTLFTKSSHQRFFQIQKSQKIIISDAKIPKLKTKECNQNNLCSSDHFRTILTSSAKHFLGVSPQASLVVATKAFFKN